MKFFSLGLVIWGAILSLTAAKSYYSHLDCLTQGCVGPRIYCDSSTGVCRAATSDTECYNATVARFQDECDKGYKCVDKLCRVAAQPVDNRKCKTSCAAGLLCENGHTTCRGPSYKNECFNLSTGFFQDGCTKGFYCSFNKCVDVSLNEERKKHAFR
ncbi:hypothetical protein CCR75_004357 [Bremia lactucae]|uniref:Secreted protein n=1 Tax=Bremia lactucae TaxID=4779 RepID=A0A976FJH9_BRELC|nr:hypothetical protein CCR75_004359 [Bremia lactucae]TDH67971.1 hypothetical protein CCR75_004357 [Bremia lactucae]